MKRLVRFLCGFFALPLVFVVLYWGYLLFDGHLGSLLIGLAVVFCTCIGMAVATSGEP